MAPLPPHTIHPALPPGAIYTFPRTLFLFTLVAASSTEEGATGRLYFLSLYLPSDTCHTTPSHRARVFAGSLIPLLFLPPPSTPASYYHHLLFTYFLPPPLCYIQPITLLPFFFFLSVPLSPTPPSITLRRLSGFCVPCICCPPPARAERAPGGLREGDVRRGVIIVDGHIWCRGSMRLQLLHPCHMYGRLVCCRRHGLR
ncbi:hypothetical protein DFH09DRAFT_561008 [Mycena vulgaris]|nr:hypothetical protein DFH09DRAFT_561008 [Mycena vulgaris]